MPEPISNPVVAAVPGGGWRVQHRDDDGATLDHPLLAWIFYADGTCKPVDVDPTAWCDDPTSDANFVRVYHPDEEQPRCQPETAGTEETEREKTTRVFAALHRSAEQDVTRVTDLYERWVKAGPPPLGVSVSRWWDARLAELHDAIRPSADA